MSNRIIEKLLNGAEVEWKPLGVVCEIADNLRKPVKASLRVSGNTPYYGANNIQDYVDGYTHDGEYVLIAEDGSASLENYSIQWVRGKFWANNHVHVIRGNGELNNRFLFHYLRQMNFIPYLSGGDRAKLTKARMIDILIPLPPLEIQEKIVKTLDKFTELEATLEATLEAELALRKKQYQYYRETLLTFPQDLDRGGYNEITKALYYNTPVVFKALGEVCDYVDYRGKTPKKVENGIYLVTAKNIKRGFIDYEVSKEYISENDYDEVMRRGLPKIGDVLITTEAPCGNIAQIDNENIALAQRVIKYRSKDNNVLSNDFLKHYLLGDDFQRLLLQSATGGTVKGIKGSTLHKLCIPIPPLTEQQKIVNILDKFDRLTNSITEGLPKEIELRRKQYEYYREQLLDFPK